MDQHVKAKLLSHGVSEHHLNALKAAAPPGFNWIAFIALVAKYGPAIAAEIIALFNAQNHPQNPAPTQPVVEMP